MYICEDCGEKFFEPYEHYETHSFKVGPYEFFRECPYCESTYIFEVQKEYLKHEG